MLPKLFDLSVKLLMEVLTLTPRITIVKEAKVIGFLGFIEWREKIFKQQMVGFTIVLQWPIKLFHSSCEGC